MIADKLAKLEARLEQIEKRIQELDRNSLGNSFGFGLVILCLGVLSAIALVKYIFF